MKLLTLRIEVRIKRSKRVCKVWLVKVKHYLKSAFIFNPSVDQKAADINKFLLK